MLVVETIARIRRAHFVQGKSIKAICRELHVSRKVVRKVLRSESTEFRYERERQPMPRLGAWRAELDRLLASNEAKPARERLTLIRIFETLRDLGYAGGYDAVRRYARTWRRGRGSDSAAAYVPLSFAPGEAYQYDWSHEVVLIGGATVTVKVAHLRLCYSRMPFVRAYPREAQEMVFDAHDRAFAFFKGACTRGIYDNLKAAVDAVFVGRERSYNRRFLQMCSHYLVEPVACTPAAGWEKGQVENQVGLVRERFFTPRLRVRNFEELNAWLLDQCVAYARAHRHPELREQTIWSVFEDERAALVPYAGRFEGFQAVTASVSKTCLVRFDNNRYSVSAHRAGARWKSALTPSGSNCVRMAAWSANIAAASDAIRPCSIPGTMCRRWYASRAHCATAPRSRIGCCRRGWNGSVASWPAAPAVIGRWWRSCRRC
jgi:transposase